MDAVTAHAAVLEERPDAERRLAALFDRHYERLYRLARRLSPSADDALDLVQETFVRVAATPAAIPAGDSAEAAYLVRTLVNLRKDQWRKARVRARHAAQLAPAPATTGPDDQVIAHTDVWRALETLAPRRRAVVVLHELEGLSASGVARLLGITAVTVRWHLFRGRSELAATMRAEGRTR